MRSDLRSLKSTEDVSSLASDSTADTYHQQRQHYQVPQEINHAIDSTSITSSHFKQHTPRGSAELSRITSKVRSITDEIFGPENREYTTEERNEQLLKDFSLEDAIALRDYRLPLKQDSEDQIHEEKGQTEVEKVFTNKSTGELEYPPDGGYGWVCVACAAVVQFSTWGNNGAFGVFLAFYLDNEVFPGATSMDFAWIAGLIVFNAQIFAPLAMIFVKMFGFKTTMAVACVVHFVGYMLASFATELWQLYVCQGVVVGMSYSFMFIPAVSIIPAWFLKRRGIATGIVMSGTGLGGVFYSLTINTIIHKTGDQRWALRMIAIIATVMISIAIYFIERRNPPPRTKMSWRNFINDTRGMFAKEILKTARLWYISIWFAFMIFCYNLVVFSYASVATSLGLTAKEASVLTALLNAGQVVGRPAMGLVADLWIGRVNYTMLLNFVIVVLIFGFWMNVTTFTALLICALCLGFTLGVGNVMNQVLIADSFGQDNFVPAWSMLNVGMAFVCLFVEVVAIAMKDDTLSNPYLYTQIFAGSICFVALLVITPLRQYQVTAELRLKRKKLNEELELIKGRNLLGVEEALDLDIDELSALIAHMDELLEPGARAYAKRLFYPTKL